MSSITFSGLASGIDSASIIEALMAVERAPLERLENDLSYYESETSAFAKLNSLLQSLQTAVNAMDTASELTSYTATSSNQNLLTAEAGSSASPGSYQIEIISLAEAQKDASNEGFADPAEQNLSGTLTIGSTSLEYDNVSLNELVKMINAADTGVQATTINDGSAQGYRLLLSGEQAGITTEISGSGSINIDTAADGHTFNASQAHIVVNNIDIYRNDNTLTDVIPGVTLDLIGAQSGSTVNLKIETDTDAVASAINNFVSSYNAIITWMSDQSDSSWGRDSNIRGVKNNMQQALTTRLEDTGSLNNLIQLGLKTDYKTGKISVDSSTLQDYLNDDLEGVLKLLAGDNNQEGIADLFGSYLKGITDSVEGIYALRKKSNDAGIKRINTRIESMELRLEKRETFLQKQYTALEEMMSTMNSQLSYIQAILGDS